MPLVWLCSPYTLLRHSPLRCVGLLVAAVLLIAAGYPSPSLAQSVEEAPVEFIADSVSSNSETGVMIATGNVVITQGKATLKADKVEYYRDEGRAIATGNVILTDPNGGVHYAEAVTLEDNFARALAEQAISKLADGSWVSADKLDFQQEKSSTFKTSRFTPCNCDFLEGETPAWELRSSSTRHDTESKMVYHDNVRMHIFSIPVMYFPFLSHPDWTVRRQSGLLPPRISFSTDLGTTYSQSFYWVTGETHDLEITPKYFTNNGDALELNYRQRWDQSNLDARIIGGRLNTYKKDREDVGGIDATFTTMLGDQWNTEARIYRASQDTFMRRYGFDTAESLKSYISTERVDHNRYSLIEAYDIQDLQSSSGEEHEPVVYPHIFHERYLESPREDLSLRLRLSATSLNNDDYTDVRRWTSELYGLEEFTTDYGIISMEGRGSGQYRDIETATGNDGYTGELGQGSIAAGVGWSMPVATVIGDRHVVVEPKTKLVSVKASDRTAKIPNRDSSDFRLDEANLFLLHREQGEDYTKTHSRVDAGASVSLYDRYLGDVSGFVGSSMRVSGSTPEGLNAASDSDRFSDVLASFTIKPEQWFSLSWAGRFHPRDFFLNETKASAAINLSSTNVRITYNQLAKSYFNTANKEKEDLVIKATQKLPNQWAVTWIQEYDMTNGARKLDDSSIALNYGGGVQNCLSISLGYNRDTTTDRDIKPIDEVFVMINFKYLGAISSTQLKKR